jgi:hypothetical protein
MPMLNIRLFVILLLFIGSLAYSYGQPTITGLNSICENESTQLSVLETYQSYLWNTGATTQSITVSSPGTYSVTVSDMTSASHVLVVNPLPQVQIVGGDKLCVGTTKTLTASAGFQSYLWSTGATTSSIQITSPGPYSVTVTDNNTCAGDASVNITEVSNPSPIIEGPDFICPGSTETLDAGNWNTYEWNDGRTSSTLSITTSGSYSVTISDQNGCEGIANKNVQEYTTTPISIEGNLSICEGESTILTVNPAIGAILWNTGSSNPSIPVSTSGTYSVTVTDNNLCQVTESVEVIAPLPSISCPEDIYVTVHDPTIDTVVHFNIAIVDNCGVSIPIIQTDPSGLTSGDLFPLGTTPQSYMIDTEGTQLGSCSFNVHVVQKSAKTIIMENGDLYVKGLYKGAIYQSPDGSCWKITINNQGEIKALKIDCPE